MDTYTLKVAGLERQLPILPVNEKLSIAAFVMFSDVEITVASAAELLKKVGDDIEAMKYNTAIAAMMTLINEFYKAGSVTKFDVETFVKILSPFAPHLCEEMWESMGHKTMLAVTPWPQYDEAKTVDSTVEIGVQFNGKSRGTVVIPADAESDAAVAAVKESGKFDSQLQDKQIVKVIYVKGKIINLIVK